MNKTATILFAGLGVASAGAIVYMLLRKRKSKEETIEPSKKNAAISKTSDANKAPLNLKDIRITVAQPQPIIKDRQKFFDEWAAEEGGIQSIKDMYAKKPSSFSSADIYYLQLKGYLPRTTTEIKGRGLV